MSIMRKPNELKNCLLWKCLLKMNISNIIVLFWFCSYFYLFKWCIRLLYMYCTYGVLCDCVFCQEFDNWLCLFFLFHKEQAPLAVTRPSWYTHICRNLFCIWWYPSLCFRHFNPDSEKYVVITHQDVLDIKIICNKSWAGLKPTMLRQQGTCFQLQSDPNITFWWTLKAFWLIAILQLSVLFFRC